MSTSAEKAFHIVMPPTDTATDARYVVQSAASGAAAGTTAIFSGLGAIPKGKVFVTFEAKDQDIYVRFKSSASAAGTTATNGMVIKAGQKEVFWLDTEKYDHVDHICPAAGGTLKWYVSSPVYEQKDLG